LRAIEFFSMAQNMTCSGSTPLAQNTWHPTFIEYAACGT
jgi:hypothetical protein